MNPSATPLRLLPRGSYAGVNDADPIRFYYWPVIGSLYRKRVEMCLSQLTGGQRVLEVGFGTGLSFLNLAQQYQEIHGIDLTADTSAVAEVFAKQGINTHVRQGNVLDLPYDEGTFDSVLLISILEHLKPQEQATAFANIRRVLKPGGQVVYGVPVESPLMVLGFRCLGYNIREHHFSTERDVYNAAREQMEEVALLKLRGALGMARVYEVGHFRKR